MVDTTPTPQHRRLMSRTPELRQRVFVHIQQASFEPGPPTQQSGAPEQVGGVKLFRERSSTIGGGAVGRAVIISKVRAQKV